MNYDPDFYRANAKTSSPLAHQNLVRRINEEAHPTPQPHPLGNRMGWAVGVFYWTMCVMVLAFVVGFLQGAMRL